MIWEERGGPRVDGQGAQGFGSQLIASTIEGGLEGRLQTDWRPEGLRCVIEFDYAIARENIMEPSADAAE
jgi:two-component sensor histidine kinase